MYQSFYRDLISNFFPHNKFITSVYIMFSRISSKTKMKTVINFIITKAGSVTIKTDKFILLEIRSISEGTHSEMQIINKMYTSLIKFMLKLIK